jgi:23S rRNA pseudouridine1911/1915/1917 synthase
MNNNNDKNIIATYSAASETELLASLFESCKGQGRNSVKALLKHKQIFVNGKNILRHDYLLKPGDVVSIRKASVRHHGNSGCILPILFEDEYLIAVEKPSGMLSVGTETQKENTVYSHLNAYIKVKQHGERIFLLHRLDRDTSGVILFAKNKEIQQAMQDAWDTVISERLYFAVVEGRVEKDQDKIVSYLTEDKNYHVFSSPFDNGGQRSVTHYRVLRRGGSRTLLELALETGKKNQIRVHLESIGHSISGDLKYGGRRIKMGRLALHAGTIAFTHPVTGEHIRIESPMPESFTNLCG